MRNVLVGPSSGSGSGRSASSRSSRRCGALDPGARDRVPHVEHVGIGVPLDRRALHRHDPGRTDAEDRDREHDLDRGEAGRILPGCLLYW